ncbi:MAG: hypothetical protein ACW99A_15325 [Candidatus Kariarchaeaceae archaeon]
MPKDHQYYSINLVAYEVFRFEYAVKSTGNEGKLLIRDIKELLDYAMGGGSPNLFV